MTYQNLVRFDNVNHLIDNKLVIKMKAFLRRLIENHKALDLILNAQ